MKSCPRCSEIYDDEDELCPRDGEALRPVRDPLIGRVIGGRFRLVERLGTGGMSSVYLGQHVMLERLMAIKTLRRDLARDRVQRDRFLREARAVNRINHDNIVEIVDYGETEDGLVYLVMEYVRGKALVDLLADGPLSPGRGLGIVRQCAQALGRAHQLGVIHRDLKPENVIVTPRPDGTDFVKLLDFGIAKILDAPSLTGSQQIFGTPGYIAPEYIQSTAIDGRADLYSLGCILYELVTGALPFDYQYPGDLLVKHVTEAPVPPVRRHPLVPKVVNDFILRCLAKDPNRRFRDAYHFITELDAVVERGEIDLPLMTTATAPGLRDTSTMPEGILRTLVDQLRSDLQAPETVADTRHAHRSAVTPVTDTERPPPIRDADSSSDDTSSADPIASSEPASSSADGAERTRGLEPAAARSATFTIPGTVSNTPTPIAMNREGIIGAMWWRERYERLRSRLADLDPTLRRPREIQHAMSFATRTLEELEKSLRASRAQQQEVERLHDRSRDVRATLGRAMDEAAGRLSEQRGVLEALVRERNVLVVARDGERREEPEPGDAEAGDALLWKLASVETDLCNAADGCGDLEKRLATLTSELEEYNESFDVERMRLVWELDAQVLQLQASVKALRRPLEEVETYLDAVARPADDGAAQSDVGGGSHG